MIKFVLPALMAVVLAFPAAAEAHNNCCSKTDCCKRQKRFAVVCCEKQVCRLRWVCVTDECGNTCRKLKRVPVTVTRKRLVRVSKPCGCRGGCGCG